MIWETVIGLEVHAELSTKSKIFCSCSTEFGGEPNSRVCPVCAGLPGSLPRLNRAVVESAVTLGLALGCSVTKSCKFDRKNYFYPDLPKAYQVSQLYSPICQGGRLEIETGGGRKPVSIREIHMEEDAGKLIHNGGEGGTFMDFNRCGVPLLEIVSQPDMENSEEACAFLFRLKETLLYLGICDCKMQEGSLRVDVNLSVRRPGGDLGTRTETKNMNSFKAVSRAVEYEAARQIAVLEAGGEIAQETRRWDDAAGASYPMRSKENARDYRYFPEPDLLPVEIDDEWLSRIKAGLPELAHEKRARYGRDFGIGGAQAAFLTGHKKISDLFEALCACGADPLESERLISGILMRLMHDAGIRAEDLSADAKKLAALIGFVTGGKINRASYGKAVGAVFLEGADPHKYVACEGLEMVSGPGEIAAAVGAALAEHAEDAAEYRSGKGKVFGFLMGQVMKKLGGKGDPAAAKEALQRALDG